MLISDNNNNLFRYAKRFSNSVRNDDQNLNENKELNYKNKDNNEKISLIKTLKSPDYRASDIIKFLSFVNNTICIPDNFRVVCHSHIMKHFIKEKIDKDFYKNLKEAEILEENLWTIFLNLKNKKNISISRHGFSYANLIKEKDKSFFGKFKQITETDAKLSVYGVFTALLHGTDLNKKEVENGMNESPDKVFVSVLIRTWMTAICLYLPHCNDTNEFILVVSPFIKEEGISLDNQPDSFVNQISYISKFLNYLIKISQIKFTRDIITQNLMKIKKYFESGNILSIYILNKKVTFKFFQRTINIVFDIKDNDPYFNNQCKDNIFDIEKIKIFHGETKPSKNDIQLKFSKWCEPFSKKSSSSNISKLCKSNLQKFNNNNNNLENESDRTSIIARPANNLNFTNFNETNFESSSNRSSLKERPSNNLNFNETNFENSSNKKLINRKNN